jgi:hypothetical protein
MFMVILLNALSTLNISVISWRSILLIEETKVPGEKHRPVARTIQLDRCIYYAIFRLNFFSITSRTYL